MKMEIELPVWVSRATKLIDDVRRTSMAISVNRADFLMMAYYLVELGLFLEELNKEQESVLAKLSCPSLQRLLNVIEGIHTFTKICASRSRIYLLCHSSDISQELTNLFAQLTECISVVFTDGGGVLSNCERMAHEIHTRLQSVSVSPDPDDNKVAEEINRNLEDKKTADSMDIDEQQRQSMDLLQKIANHLNMAFSEVSVLQTELQKDLTMAESEGREADTQELKKLCGLLCSSVVTDDRRILPPSEPSMSHVMYSWEIPSSFYCPITKEIMQEPAMVEKGHTYEKAAISEWFQRGHRTCPDTGEELKSLELVPNVTLKKAMDEYFLKLHTQQLMCSLQELREESTPAGIEARINRIKDILGMDSGYIRLLVALGGVGSLISVLKSSSPQIRGWIFRLLYRIALLGDSYKLSIVEEKAIPMFIRILQKSPDDARGPLQLLWELSKCEAASKVILSENGAVLIIASACNLCQNDQKLLAEKLLENLCHFDESVIIEAAKSSVFGPLISGLGSGDEELKLKLSIAISESLELNEHDSTVLVKAGVIHPLLDLLQFGIFESKQAAGKALHQLSATHANIPFFVEEGAIPVLVKLLSTSVPQLKIDALAILSNLVTDAQVATEIEQEGTVTHHLGLFLGDPLMQEHSIKTLQCMARDSQRVRKSILNLVPILYRLLKEERLSSSSRCSLLGLLRFLAEDRETRNALQTSSEMIEFLLNLVGEVPTVDEKDIILHLMAGLSKLEGMKPRMVSEIQLLGLCLDYLKSYHSHSMQEAAAVISSQLFNPDLVQPSTLVNFARQGLVSTLAEISRSAASTERAKHYAIMTLGHLSSCTPILTEHQSFLERLLAWLGLKKFKICDVHSGKCSITGTLCIVQAGMVPSLIDLVKNGGSQSAEQAIALLKTLIDHTENHKRGVDFLVKNGIISSLVSIVGKSNASDEKIASMMELIFQVKKYRHERFSKAPAVSLARILGTGSAAARKAAGTALMHLKKVQRDSTYERFTSTTTS